MTITVATVISAIKRHLSIIGKRLYSKDGKNMFSDITLSSAEDTNILTQYITASAQDVESVLKQFITASTYSSSAVSMTITNTRGDSDFETRTQALAESYVTLNSICEYLSMVHPDLAAKYQRDARQRIESLVEYVFYKKPPTATASQTSGTATVS
jgi:glutamine synthetase adenylyltransferase